MAYDGNKTWSDFEREMQGHGNGIIRAAKLGEELYQDLLVYADGRTNAQIAADTVTFELLRHPILMRHTAIPSRPRGSRPPQLLSRC